MKEQAVAKVYARSLLEIGEEKKVNIADDLTKLTVAINSSNELENVMFLEVFTLEEKKSVFGDVAKKIGLNPVTTNIVNFLIDEKRIGILPLIFKEIIVIDDEKRGFIKGTIEGNTAEIDDATRSKITAFIKSKLGREPHLDYVQNGNVSAGFKVTVEDLQLDASLDNQLEKFKQSIIGE